MLNGFGAGDSFWTHLELAGSIVMPIGAGLAHFFNVLIKHAQDDKEAFNRIDVSLAKVDTKLDAMWDDWKKNGAKG